MNFPENNVIPLNPDVLLRVMLYNDPTQNSATQLAPDAWVDFDTAFGPTFQAGTEHQISLVNADRTSSPFRVTVTDFPLLEQKPHPDDEEIMIPVATLYLMPAA
ncbi:hypothetical protein [Spirosoma sp. KNUC1025]|uniref:hypothetical protein n=1 Tax=Spirosoma sp. KNUC1025 TaxID=2894082 RepID=UPI003867DA61|nr:hypothetical protein LN737_17665 [Spirosoma sp. KNUC1025]